VKLAMLWGAGLAFTLSACGHGASAPGDAAMPPAPTDAGCSLTQIPLVVEPQVGVPQQLYVNVTYEQAPAQLFVDTGSELTFIQEPVGSPDPVPDAGTVTLGCETKTIIGRPEEPFGDNDGIPVIGTLGTDLLLSGPSKIDFANALIELHASGQPFPEAAAWPQAPYDVSYGIVLIHVVLDGVPVRLEVDTGSGELAWVGQPGQPGDSALQTVDAEGNPITIYQGSVDLAIGDWHGTVPCGRIPTWPYFMEGVAILGGNIDGVIGLSALGKGFVFDTDATVVRVNHPIR
jgi:hypothetical protein